MQFLLVESCSDYSYHARSLGSGLSYLALARHIVELQPSSVGILYDALCSDDLTAFIQTVNDILELSLGILVACLSSDFIEYLISIVSVVVMMVMVVMSASALMVVVVVMMVVLMLMLIMIMVMMMFAMFVFIIIVMMVVMMVFMLMFMSLEFLVCLFSELVEFGVQCLVGLHYLKHLGAGQLIPVSRHDLRSLVECPDVLYYLIEFGRSHALLMRKEDGACVLYLVREELSKVLHVHLISLGVDYCRESVKFDLVVLKILHGDDDV